MIENEGKWKKMRENERRWKENERKWEKMTENERKWRKMKENERKWEKMRENERTWTKMKENERKWKKMRGSELAAESSPSTRRACGVPMVPEEDESEPVSESESDAEEDRDLWVDDAGRQWMRTAARPWRWYLLGTGFDGECGCFSWLLGGERGTGECVFRIYPLAQRQAEQPLGSFQLSSSPSCVSLRWLLKDVPVFLALGRISAFLARAALFTLGNMAHYFLLALYLAVTRPVTGCCLWDTELDYSGDSAVIRAQCLAWQWTHVLHQHDGMHTFSTAKWTRILTCFLRSHAEWRSVFSWCLKFLEIGNSMHELHVGGSLHDEGKGVGAHLNLSQWLTLHDNGMWTHALVKHGQTTSTTTTILSGEAPY